MASFPDFDLPIKYRTYLGWFIGKRQKVTFSYGGETSFFVNDHIPENKHWTYFTETEIYVWEYLSAT